MISSQPSRPSAAERQGGDSERLLDAARQFDPAALGHIFDESFETIHGLLVGLLGDRPAAEEAALATYERVLDRLSAERGRRAGLNGWLAHTACREAMRRRPVGLSAAVQPGMGPRPYDPRRVRGALWSLPADQREVVTLRALAGMDSAHVAAASGRSVGLVLSLQQRALRTLAGDQRRSSYPRGSETTLDRTLDRVTAGADPEAAVAAVADAQAQLPLVQAAHGVTTLRPGSADTAARARTRDALLGEATEKRAHWVHSHQGIPIRPLAPRRPFRPLRALGRLVGGTMILFLAVVIGVGLAAMAVTSEPDSPAYPLRRVAENALVLAHRDPVSRATLEVDLADQRLREAEAMALANKASLAVPAVHDRYVELLQASRALIDDSSAHDSSWRAARTKLIADESVSLQSLETQLEASGDSWAAAAIRSEVSSFQNERKYLDEELGVSPAQQQPQPSSAGQTTAIP
ncbi:MAG TPA: DUF5667 domain-containing protein [Candidatus Dormibacteraeota bacterium]